MPNFANLSDSQLDEAEKVFDIYDTEKSGQLQRKQLLRAIRSMGHFVKKEEAEQILQDHDEDHDGTIGIEEWYTIVADFARAAEIEAKERVAARGTDWEPRQPEDGSYEVRKEIKKALLVGVTYPGTGSALPGCSNDVRTMQRLLKWLGLEPLEVQLYTDDESFSERNGLPTKENIENGLRWIAEGAEPGDNLFIHFSGHGYQLPCENEEDKAKDPDGFDEALVPMDFEENGSIRDNQIDEFCARPLPRGVRLTAIFDCCHSGSMMDLPFVFGRGMEGDPSGEACVVMFSGCQDEQESADCDDVVGGFKGKLLPGNPDAQCGGVCTAAMVESFMDVERPSVGRLFEALRGAVSTKGFQQVPQLSGSHELDPEFEFTFCGPLMPVLPPPEE